MTEQEYRNAEGISRSELWRLSSTPEKFKWQMEHPEPPTPALLFGQAAHKFILQPESFDEEFVVAPIVDRRTKAGKDIWADFEAAAGDRAVIDSAQFDTIANMASVMNENSYVQKLLEGTKELPYIWTDELTGEICKVRLDCLSVVGDKHIIVDYKTAMDAGTDAFMHSAVKHGYDFQAAMYLEGCKAVSGEECLFVFIAQEKEPPYSVNIMQADDVFIRRGRDIFRQLIGTYHDCKESGNWWGYLGPYNVVNNLALPAWLAKEVE